MRLLNYIVSVRELHPRIAENDDKTPLGERFYYQVKQHSAIFAAGKGDME